MRRFYLPWCALLCLGLGGCGPSRGNISGEVKFKGKPLPAGKVTLLYQEGRQEVVNGEIRDGKYQLADVPVGPAIVMVATIKPVANRAPRPGAPAAAAPPPGLVLARPPGAIDAEPEAPAEQLAKYVEIPRRYSQADQSGLKYTVQGGDQVHDIDLTP